MAWVVAIYHYDLKYGGPEEGGWYYETGYPDDEFCMHTRGYEKYEQAQSYRAYLDGVIIPKLNEGRREVSSVLSEGRYKAVITRGNPLPYPREIPHYE